MFEYFGLTAERFEEDNLKPQWRLWIASAVVLLIAVSVIKGLFGDFVPFGTWEFWQPKGNVQQWLSDSWIVFAWGSGITLLFALITRNSYQQNLHAERFIANGLSVSLRAGIMEEIIFRWLLLMTGIFGVRVADYILGGFIFEHGVVYWLQTHLFLPLFNWCSFGMLAEWLKEPNAWFVASGIIAANVKFRDGHKYQGLLGMANSWFIGLFFFHLMFKYGLPAAILVHVLYDVFIFVIRYVDRVVERAQSKRKQD